MATKIVITQELLQQLIHYSPETGMCIWLTGRNEGSEVGWLDDTFHLRTKYKGVTYQLSHWIWMYMTGEFPKWEIDHINGIEYDNRWENLRDVPHSVNGKNQKRKINNSSGTTGVTWYKANQAWGVNITVDDERKFCGLHKSLEEAIKARKAAEQTAGFHPNTDRSFS